MSDLDYLCECGTVASHRFHVERVSLGYRTRRPLFSCEPCLEETTTWLQGQESDPTAEITGFTGPVSMTERFYPVRISGDGTFIRSGGSGDWYVLDSTAGSPVTWVGFRTKRQAQSQSDERNRG